MAEMKASEMKARERTLTDRANQHDSELDTLRERVTRLETIIERIGEYVGVDQ